MPTLSPRYLGADVPPVLGFAYLWSVMLFPGDADRRREFRNALAASAVRERLKGQPVPADLAERLIAAPAWRQTLRGADAAERDGRFAGAVLGQALQAIETDCPKLASRGRVFAAAAEIRLGNRSGRSSQKTMFRAWRRHRAVAHLWLARILVGEDVFFECATDRRPLLVFLAAAEAFRRRGEAWIPHHGRAGEPLLDPAEMWRVPDEVALPSVTAPLGHPSAERLALLNRVRAEPRW